MTPERLPEYRVKARNTPAHAENKIHDDAVARQYGFRGGLVPGVTVYAYLTHPLVEAFGAAWLERGTAEVRFVRPVLDGEEVTVSGTVTARDARAVRASRRFGSQRRAARNAERASARWPCRCKHWPRL